MFFFFDELHKQIHSKLLYNYCSSVWEKNLTSLSLPLLNKSVSPDDLLLRMGEYDLGSTDEPQGHVDRKVQIVASHPKFDPKTFEYDLALLRFYEPVEFAPNVIPICVPETDRELVGETAWVTGWGRLYEGGFALLILSTYFINF